MLAVSSLPAEPFLFLFLMPHLENLKEGEITADIINWLN